MKHAHNFKDVTGQTFGYLTAVKPVGIKSFFYKRDNKEMRRAIWLFRCVCGNEIERTRREITNYKFKGLPSCGCQITVCGNNHGLWRGYGEIPKTYFNRIKKQAHQRSLEFDLAIEYIWELFLKQNRCCNLSGEKLQFGTSVRVKHKREQTASLDRIDSSKGYVKGNVQWVHKRINCMKMEMSQQDLIEWCKKILTTTNQPIH